MFLWIVRTRNRLGLAMITVTGMVVVRCKVYGTQMSLVENVSGQEGMEGILEKLLQRT